MIGKALAHADASCVDLLLEWRRWGMSDYEASILFNLKMSWWRSLTVAATWWRECMVEATLTDSWVPEDGWHRLADLARLVAAIDGEPGVKNILSDESISTMTSYDEKENMSRGWGEISPDGRWRRTGTLSSTHALVERYPQGDCWVILTNSGVWTGHHFSRDLQRLIERLRSRYGNELPCRNLW